jgi:hypothetical protein
MVSYAGQSSSTAAHCHGLQMNAVATGARWLRNDTAGIGKAAFPAGNRKALKIAP